MTNLITQADDLNEEFIVVLLCLLQNFNEVLIKNKRIFTQTTDQYVIIFEVTNLYQRNLVCLIILVSPFHRKFA